MILRMDRRAHIERVPGVMRGKPVFRDTRITVEFVLERLAPDDLVRSHPPLTPDHAKAALAYALSAVRQDEMVLST